MWILWIYFVLCLTLYFVFFSIYWPGWCSISFSSESVRCWTSVKKLILLCINFSICISRIMQLSAIINLMYALKICNPLQIWTRDMFLKHFLLLYCIWNWSTCILIVCFLLILLLFVFFSTYCPSVFLRISKVLNQVRRGYLLYIYLSIFSSPELKAQVSISDCLSSVVCLSVCPSVCKPFLFSTSSPEPLGQFQPNLAQSILGWMGFKFVQINCSVLF